MYVDEVEVDDEGIAEMLMDDNAISQVLNILSSFFSTRKYHGVECRTFSMIISSVF